ncbi:uncharacterized protein TNCV_1499151 [Trichonephila clavipes]|nr:uncharacterized protein TNCV_1499151 [Trichonephila clavipes]
MFGRNKWVISLMLEDEMKSYSALVTVEGFAITAENYAKAVEILKDRFGRKDAIINSHMQKLLSVTPLKRSDDTKELHPFEKKTRIELEEAAEDHFARQVTRDADGRYVVSLPWIRCHSFLSNCRNLAEKRLKYCVRSLERSKNLGQYEAVFHNWLNEDIIEEVPNDADKKNEHYLPHHPVYKDNSTTKIRPVFDGSAKEKNSSINECLQKGPNMVELIPTIINKFRLRKFGIIADIDKAFLQIGLQEKDRPFLRFLWWENGDKEKTKIYQHKRIVFGITSSPFLFGATLEHHLKQVSGHLQLTAQKLLESFYVDNCVTSVDNAEDIKRFMLESKESLSLAKFNLRGCEHTGVSEAKKGTLLEEEKKVPVLGLIWKPDKYTLSVKWEENSKINEIPITKRKILSAVHRIFDPIGFTCPVEVEVQNEVKDEAVETKDQEKDEETSEEKDNDKEKEKEDKKEEKDDKKEVKKPKPKGPKSVGQSFVVSVQGYYCKLCHKFFKEVSVEKSKHCRSLMHTEAFKKAMEEAIEQEEERQRLAAEQDKQNKRDTEGPSLSSNTRYRNSKVGVCRESSSRAFEICMN